MAEVKKAVTGVRSEMSFPYMNDASFAEMTFLFIKAELGEFYAALLAKGMGLEVTPTLLARSIPSARSTNRQFEAEALVSTGVKTCPLPWRTGATAIQIMTRKVIISDERPVRNVTDRTSQWLSKSA